METKNKSKILIADDSEMNRSILLDMLEEEYEIIEAENGTEAVAILQQMGTEIALVLLDIVMPELDGFGVLDMMNKYRWIEDIPVIIISAESSSTYLDRAFELGVTDYISRPFDNLIVQRRVTNTILLYAKQKRLFDMVADQIMEKEKQSSLMIDILSHIVEFRNGESGLHTLHIHTITELLLKRLGQMSDKYKFSHQEISAISTASALHDIGKIAIPSEILNKPGKLTKEEYEIMKTHSAIGDSMLEQIPFYQDEEIVKAARQICRWHHERYDGRGYPDGLKGDQIPISAQIVALADVYDALTSERAYKKAFSHEKAIEMISNGECGVFNPELLGCFRDIADDIRAEFAAGSGRADMSMKEVRSITDEILHRKELTTSDRTLRLLEHERSKYRFFASMSNEIQFEYTVDPPMITLTDWGAEQLGVKEIIMDPKHNEDALRIIGKDALENLGKQLRNTTPENPIAKYNCQLHVKGEARWYQVICRATWSVDEPSEYLGAIGKAVDVHNEHTRMTDLERVASHDGLTGLLNRSKAEQMIRDRLMNNPNGNYALFIIDLDYFKNANDQYGHLFGDEVLKYLAEKLRQSVRGGDIVARVGGDEFLIFLEYRRGALESSVDRIFHHLEGQYEDFKMSVSMGVANISGEACDYETLFHCADQALYASKRAGRGQYKFYDESMIHTLSVISPIDRGGEEEVR
ncbi:MAG: diguanylate cyclase [Lachnospiraceae bacterium]|nr:diguanylate cyclase [Lachnospiraceae bacterium]